jgi:hypothetical protein
VLGHLHQSIKHDGPGALVEAASDLDRSLDQRSKPEMPPADVSSGNSGVVVRTGAGGAGRTL